jgi:hypothetical protein
MLGKIDKKSINLKKHAKRHRRKKNTRLKRPDIIKERVTIINRWGKKITIYKSTKPKFHTNLPKELNPVSLTLCNLTRDIDSYKSKVKRGVYDYQIPDIMDCRFLEHIANRKNYLDGLLTQETFLNEHQSELYERIDKEINSDTFRIHLRAAQKTLHPFNRRYY